MKRERELDPHRVEGRLFQTEETIPAKVLRQKDALRMFQKLNGSQCGWGQQRAGRLGQGHTIGTLTTQPSAADHHGRHPHCQGHHSHLHRQTLQHYTNPRAPRDGRRVSCVSLIPNPPPRVWPRIGVLRHSLDKRMNEIMLGFIHDGCTQITKSWPLACRGEAVRWQADQPGEAAETLQSPLRTGQLQLWSVPMWTP